jgi:hypothetical protein
VAPHGEIVDLAANQALQCSSEIQENSKLGRKMPLSQYKFHQEGKRSQMTTLRIQELESLGFNGSLLIRPGEKLETMNFDKGG